MPEILDAALRFKADLAAREATAMRSMASHYASIQRGLQSEINALARTMAARHAQGLPVSAGYLYRTERYQTLLVQAFSEFKKYEDFATPLIASQQAQFARLGVDHALSLLDIAEPGIGGGFNRLSLGAIENIAGFVADGSPLRNLLADAWPSVIDQTTDALVRGVALGYNPTRIARMMQQAIGGGLQRSIVIARTETQRAYRTTKQEMWRETGLVRGFQRVATHDRRCCPGCLFSDGKFFPLGEDMAEHPQGRCSMIPVTRNSGLHQWEYGAEWFERQPVPTQISIMGPGRLAAWNAGRFDLRDIPAVQANDVWGPTLRSRGLAELTGQGRGAARVVPPVAPEQPPEWRPSMSRQEAERWAANSQYKDDVYHITPGVANERSIKADGFNLDVQKFGRMWGDGVYVGTDAGAADTYRKWTGPSARTLTIKLDVQNVLVFNAKKASTDYVDIVQQALGVGRKKAAAAWYESEDKPSVKLTKILSEAGYDALQIIDTKGGAGGNQLVVFDPKKVVAINE